MFPVPFAKPAPAAVPVQQTESWAEKHFLEIAMSVSCLALLIFATGKLICGIPLGYVLNAFFEPKPKTAQKLTLVHTLIAMVGAFAAAISITPAGSAGGFVFQSIPFLGSLAIGSTLYRMVKT